MAIDSLNHLNRGNFLTLTGANNGQKVAYYQGRATSPQTNPYEGKSLFENINTLEARKSGASTPVNNTQQVASKGSIWNNFSVPQFNGTGELSPQYNPDERILDLKA